MSYLPNAQINAQVSVPIAGGTITVTPGVEAWVAVPAGTLATLTFSLPSAPPDGSVFNGASTQIITALTVNSQGADTVVGAPSSLAANGFFCMVYVRANTSWYRIS